jgi:copper chaperone CopZ
MKKLIYVFVVVMFVGLTSNEIFAQKNDTKVVCFKSNMDCIDCENTITEYLKFEKGVKKLKVDHVSNIILIEYKESKNTNDKLAKAIEKKGYKADELSMAEYGKIITEMEGHIDTLGKEEPKKLK